MFISPYLTTILRTQAAALEFMPGWNLPAAAVTARPWHNWLGACQPDRRHAIEIIGPANASAAPDLLPARLSDRTAQPVGVIFCAGQTCPGSLHTALQARDIGVMHTPLADKLVIRTLLTVIAAQLEIAQVHGVYLSIHGLGVLLTGASGTGKSSLALELLERGHVLVADDVCRFYRMPDTPHIHGICPPMLYDLLHIDELGVLNVAKLFGPASSLASHELHLVIELVDGYRPAAAQRLVAQPEHYQLLDTTLPLYKFSPRQIQNMALLVETAVRNQVLYRDGYDANADLAQRQQQLLHSV